MKLTTYDTYKDSRVEWLGKVPEHWEIRRIKDATLFQFSNVDKKSYENQEEVLLCNYTDVYKNDFITADMPFMKATASVNEIRRFKLQNDDVIITKDSETFDDIANAALVKIGSKDLICGYHLALIRPKPDTLKGGYLFRLFHSRDYNIPFAVIAKGVTRVGLGLQNCKNTPVIIPPLPEQTQIVNYLDQATTKIDKKIDLLTQKIKHYQDLKTALINRAVTKGLDDNVEMKDSGVEWIGDIPKHWEVKRLKDLSILNQESLNDTTPSNYKFQYIDIGNVGNYGLSDKIEIVEFNESPSRARKIVRKGDTIISTVRTYLKAIAYFENEIQDVIVSTGFAVLSPLKSVYSKYLYFSVFSNFFIEKVVVKSVGVSYPAINSNALSSIFLLLPPINEQKEIVEYLNQKIFTVDRIVKTITTQIKHQKELRKTLINDIVTGKVKVENN